MQTFNVVCELCNVFHFDNFFLERRKLFSHYLQVKVWFQNRRMKWRHAKESKQPFHQEKYQDEEEERKSETTIKPVALASSVRS